MKMHPLDAWLSSQDRRRPWLAAKLGITSASLSRIVAGSQWPRREFFVSLQRLTHGELTVADFLPPGTRS